jgi:hypothetical protein
MSLLESAVIELILRLSSYLVAENPSVQPWHLGRGGCIEAGYSADKKGD